MVTFGGSAFERTLTRASCRKEGSSNFGEHVMDLSSPVQDSTYCASLEQEPPRIVVCKICKRASGRTGSVKMSACSVESSSPVF